MTIIFDIKELSKEIHLAEKTIRTTLVRNPGALPPRLLIPGQKRLLWLKTDVEAFYESQVRVHGSNPRFSIVNKSIREDSISALENGKTRKRGRPSKSEQLARQKLKNK